MSISLKARLNEMKISGSRLWRERNLHNDNKFKWYNINYFNNLIKYKHMKRLLFFLFLFLILNHQSEGQNNVGINDNNSSPNSSAMLDVYSTNKGLLIPRIALSTSATALPVSGPVSSLLVYNTATAGDVFPGYYYWNATKWVRLTANTDPEKNLSLVSKSANTTLLKTENMIVATGNIILSLPTVTSADDGLEITVKNTGTFTDLIKVVPQAGKKIDADDTSYLTRWVGKTFIASNTNWILKEKEPHTINHLDVSSDASFTSIAEVVAFMNLHMRGPTVVRLGGETYSIDATQTIDLPYPVTFQGLSFGETFVDATVGVTASPLFTCITECYFKMITFNAIANTSGNDAIRFTGSQEYYEVKDCYFLGFNKGIVSTNNNEIWVFETDFENCAGAGVEIAAGTASGGSLKLSETDFIQCKRGIRLFSGVSETVSILNCGFYNTTASTDTAVVYSPAAFTSISSMFITNNTWNNQGVFFFGFDFSRSDGRDANIFMENNAGASSKRPQVKINVVNNTTTTTVSTANTWYKANFTNTSSIPTKWTVANNRITYQSLNSSDGLFLISGNVKCSSTSRTVNISIVKNGVSTTRYGETTVRITASSQSFQFSTNVYVPNIQKNDYFEIWVTSSSSGDVLTIDDFNWFTDTH